MIELLKFSLSGFWIFIGSFLFFAVALQLIVNVITRFYRMIMVLCRNWPPNHLDADGDWQVSNKEIDKK